METLLTILMNILTIAMVLFFGLFMFCSIRSAILDWRNQESKVKRYGCD